MMTPPSLGLLPVQTTVFSGRLIFASPFHRGGGGGCPANRTILPFPPPKKKTPTVLFISYFSKNKTKRDIHKKDKKEGAWGQGGTMTEEFCRKSKHSGGKY